MKTEGAQASGTLSLMQVIVISTYIASLPYLNLEFQYYGYIYMVHASRS